MCLGYVESMSVVCLLSLGKQISPKICCTCLGNVSITGPPCTQHIQIPPVCLCEFHSMQYHYGYCESEYRLGYYLRLLYNWMQHRSTLNGTLDLQELQGHCVIMRLMQQFRRNLNMQLELHIQVQVWSKYVHMMILEATLFRTRCMCDRWYSK